jgi:hypothetical protein
VGCLAARRATTTAKCWWTPSSPVDCVAAAPSAGHFKGNLTCYYRPSASYVPVRCSAQQDVWCVLAAAAKCAHCNCFAAALPLLLRLEPLEESKGIERAESWPGCGPRHASPPHSGSAILNDWEPLGHEAASAAVPLPCGRLLVTVGSLLELPDLRSAQSSTQRKTSRPGSQPQFAAPSMQQQLTTLRRSFTSDGSRRVNRFTRGRRRTQ